MRPPRPAAWITSLAGVLVGINMARHNARLARLIEAARRLPVLDRLRLIEAIENSIEHETGVDTGSPAAYGPLLALSGRTTSAFSDVSTAKYSHVAEACAPRLADD